MLPVWFLVFLPKNMPGGLMRGFVESCLPDLQLLHQWFQKLFLPVNDSRRLPIPLARLGRLIVTFSQDACHRHLAAVIFCLTVRFRGAVRTGSALFGFALSGFALNGLVCLEAGLVERLAG